MTTRDFVPLTQYTELKNNFLKLNDRRNKLEIENARLKEELKDYEYQHKQDGICYDDIFFKLELARKENTKLKTDCRTLAQTLLKVSPEHKAWLEKNYKEYL